MINWAKAFDERMFPLLDQTIEILDRALEVKSLAVLEDQRDRYRGFLLCSHSDRNLYLAQASINRWLLKQGDQAETRHRLDSAIQAGIENTRNWVSALKTSRTNWFHLAVGEETPFLYKTPIEDLEIKPEAMQAHRNDEPGPYLAQLSEPMPTLMFQAIFH